MNTYAYFKTMKPHFCFWLAQERTLPIGTGIANFSIRIDVGFDRGNLQGGMANNTKIWLEYQQVFEP